MHRQIVSSLFGLSIAMSLIGEAHARVHHHHSHTRHHHHARQHVHGNRVHTALHRARQHVAVYPQQTCSLLGCDTFEVVSHTFRAVESAADNVIAGPRSALLNVAYRYLGRGNFTGFREAWCADAMNVWLRQAGYRPQKSHRAIDFARYGKPTHPHVGAIAVMRHHVGIVAKVRKGGVELVSGNHRHRVGEGFYPAYRIVSYRDPI